MSFTPQSTVIRTYNKTQNITAQDLYSIVNDIEIAASVNAGVTGSGTATQVTVWSSSSAVTSYADLLFSGPSSVLQIGAGAIGATANALQRRLAMVSSGVPSVSANLANVWMSNTNTAGGTNIAFYESTTGKGQVIRYNTTFAGNFTGTSIAKADLLSVESGLTANIRAAISGSEIFGIIGQTATNFGYKQDAVGLRVDQIGNLHSPNVAALGVVGVTGYNQLNAKTPYTPTDSTDVNGSTGDIAWDEGFIYVKAAAGWARAAIAAF